MFKKLEKAYKLSNNQKLECIIDNEGVNFIVPSNSNPEKKYDVNMNHDGRTRCTCPDYYNRSKEEEPGSYQCIHILAGLFALGRNQERLDDE